MQHRQPTVLQFYMKMKSKNKSEAKAGKSGHKAHDVGIGCMKELPKIGSFKTEKVYPFVGESMHTSTRLRVIEIISYESSKYKKKKGGGGKNSSRQGTGADSSALTVKMLQKCKLAFTQTRD